MIHLKIKSKTDNELFGSQIRPYVEKVTEQFSQTQISPELITPLEQAIRNKTKSEVEKTFCANDFDTYKTIYLGIARHLIENLKTNNSINNIELIEKVNNKTISVETLVELNPQEMHHERWRKCIEKKISDINKLTKDPEATTTLFWCSRCNRNKCTYFERQDRSADEPMTIHITCCHCGKKWKN